VLCPLVTAALDLWGSVRARFIQSSADVSVGFSRDDTAAPKRLGGVSHFQPYQLCVLTELRERGNLLLNAHGTLGFRWEMIKCQINRIEKLLCTYVSARYIRRVFVAREINNAVRTSSYNVREAAGKSGFHGFRAFSRLLAHKVVKMSVVEPIAIDHQEVSSLLESI
jgi:hypothetical protein